VPGRGTSGSTVDGVWITERWLGAVFHCVDAEESMRIVISALFLFVFSLILCFAPAEWRGKPRDLEK
jgi:hypothetical protein